MFPSTNTVKRARRLRREMTLPEILLWQQLRGRKRGQGRFRRQHPFGPYVIDFFCEAARLAVEVDGAAHDEPQRVRADASRDAFLRSHGVRVIRVPAIDVLRDPGAVADYLVREAGGFPAEAPAH